MSSARLRPATLFATIVVAGCQVQANAPQGPLDALHPLVAAKHASSSSELFVGDVGGTVYVFPIQNGLPTTTPARTLATGMELLNVAVAPDGTLFAAGQAGSTSEVAVYAPGAQGSGQPERVVDTPGEAWSVAVDVAGFLYAGIPRVGVEVYPPGAQGPDQPVAMIPETRFTGGLGFDLAGNLYVTNYANGLTEYATPESNPTVVRSTCFAIASNLNGVALNSHGTAFVAVDGAEHFPRDSYISPVARGESGCPFRRRRLYADPVFRNPIGVAELDGHLFVSDTSFGTVGNAVVVMDESQRGHRAPLFVLTNPGFSQLRGIAIGP
jgi:hypothetical protein